MKQPGGNVVSEQDITREIMLVQVLGLLVLLSLLIQASHGWCIAFVGLWVVLSAGLVHWKTYRDWMREILQRSVLGQQERLVRFCDEAGITGPERDELLQALPDPVVLGLTHREWWVIGGVVGLLLLALWFVSSSLQS
ncbi:hypothetical protein [Deinococcus roseus]|uniref:Uncharacterized protein n=1 Tax=Deinococcus roseus TaxID=392414 RepID=A0ABQ2D602_9DEIO|nr:hypothetical protein [Deinococcus roseus]GGJ44423.1 hypothetical protein GCM10008938_33290 [Deinococcus roseus]